MAEKLINVHAAKTQFSKLLARVAKGERIGIAKNGVKVAELVPPQQSGATVHFGECRGRVWMSDDFNAPSPDIEETFYK